MTPAAEQIQALSEAMWQLLDDMGAHGTCVCLAAKAQARIAYEPFRLAETKELREEVPCDFLLAEAEAIVADSNRSWRTP